MEAGQEVRKVNPLVKLFVLWHMFVVIVWTLPKPAPAVANGTLAITPANVASHLSDYLLLANDRIKFKTPIRYYMFSTGLWQYWDMFSPNPANTDIWWDAIVTYKSGKKVIAVYPRMKTMGVFEKYFKERYRKFLERMNTDATDSWKRPDFAQRMALLSYKDPDDPPIRVQLRRHYRVMESMYKPVPEKYSEYILFDYLVNQDQLKRESGR